MAKRYQMRLAPCEATDKKSWGFVIGEGDSILELFDNVGWAGYGYAWDQVKIVVDTKKNVEMTESEYADLVKRLKGWN